MLTSSTNLMSDVTNKAPCSVSVEEAVEWLNTRSEAEFKRNINPNDPRKNEWEKHVKIERATADNFLDITQLKIAFKRFKG